MYQASSWMRQTQVKVKSRILEESHPGMVSGRREGKGHKLSYKETPVTCKTVETLGTPFSGHNAIKLESTNKTKRTGRFQDVKPLKYVNQYQCDMNNQNKIIERFKNQQWKYYILRCVGGTKSG